MGSLFSLALFAAGGTASAGSDNDVALRAVERAQQALFAKVASSVVFLTSQGSFGSGFFVDESGLILTNRHVVGDADSIDVVLHDGRKLVGKVVERAPEGLDLALVRVASGRVPALSTGRFADLRVGSFVASVGHGEGAIWTFNTGMVSNIYPAANERPIFQTQIPLNSGNSGGPIVDRSGRVVGVVTAGIKGANSINFGIRIDVALRSLESLADRCACISVRAPAGVAVFVDGALAGVGPRVVVPARQKTYEVFAVVGGVMKKARIQFPSTRTVELK
ncbi:MAG: trypsin-like peptidase domain-containing protein [Deltaproteobacteria bacterium]|nr:trypsin-like peptidase domain-containing protein [Deltaproteobacteria bacterium]